MRWEGMGVGCGGTGWVPCGMGLAYGIGVEWDGQGTGEAGRYGGAPCPARALCTRRSPMAEVAAVTTVFSQGCSDSDSVPTLRSCVKPTHVSHGKCRMGV